MNNLIELIHGYNIYENFDHSKYTEKLIGWNINKEFFKKLIYETKPNIILELGSWYGASAITIGKIIKELNLNSKIIDLEAKSFVIYYSLSNLKRWIEKLE